MYISQKRLHLLRLLQNEFVLLHEQCALRVSEFVISILPAAKAKYQESKQSSTTPDSGHHVGK